MGDQLSDDVSSMDINGANGHDLLAIALSEFSNEQGDEVIQLGDLWETRHYS